VRRAHFAEGGETAQDDPVDVEGARCSDGCVGDEEELLQPKRQLPPRRIRLVALLLAVVVVAALIAIRVWPRSTHPGAAVPPGTTPVQSAVSPPAATMTRPPWPTEPGACDAATEVPIVSSTAPNEHTGIRVLLGGNQIRAVDFDSGHVAAIPRVSLPATEFVADLIASAQTYALTSDCRSGQSRLLRIGADPTVNIVTVSGFIDGVLADGAHAWGVLSSKNNHTSGYLTPLDGGGRVRLPAGFFPDAITRGVLVGNAATAEPTTGALLLVDATTGRVRARLEKGAPIAVGHGVVLWTIGCDPSREKPCTLHRRSVAGGTTASYRLPRPPCCGAGALSPDGRRVAFPLERAAQDPRYQLEHPIPPSDIAVLHLDTGRLEIVSGIELPAMTSPALAFTADSRWLVIALDAGPQTRLLAWRSGLAHPYGSKPITGPTMASPPMLVLP